VCIKDGDGPPYTYPQLFSSVINELHSQFFSLFFFNLVYLITLKKNRGYVWSTVPILSVHTASQLV
jgi:hypothetical protein